MNSSTQRKREDILAQIRGIDRLRQGTISEQFYGSGEKRQGPYYLLQGYREGKHWSRRIPTEQIEQVRADVDAAAHFKELCEQFAEVTEEATVADEGAVSKKNARKSAKSATRKPKRSSR